MSASAADDPVVREIREQITQLDREILARVNHRLELVQQLHDHKLERGYPILDRGREEALLASLAEHNGGPLSTEGLRELFATLIALTTKEAAARRP
jgi:chorismate mutase